MGILVVFEKNTLINSGEFNGLSFEEAFKAIEKKANELGCGKKSTNFRLFWGGEGFLIRLKHYLFWYLQQNIYKQYRLRGPVSQKREHQIQATLWGIP